MYHLNSLLRRFRSIFTNGLVLGATVFLVACGGGPQDPFPSSFSLELNSSPDLDGPVGQFAILGTAPDQRPAVADTPDGLSVHAVFSFDTSSLPVDAVIANATMTITSVSSTGDPADMTGGVMVVDHLHYADDFPVTLSDIVFIIQSGIHLWENVASLGIRIFDVTEQVRVDRLAGRTRSQFRIRGLVATNMDNRVDMVSFAGGEDREGEDKPTLLLTYE